MESVFIDINCDVGEGLGNETELLPLISSCNIACGGHAGDYKTMSHVVELAQEHGVLVGAHPSYPDKENFGREIIEIDSHELIHSIQNQIKDLTEILERFHVSLNHIKPHGALYNELAKNVTLSNLFLESIETYKQSTFVYVPPNSVIEKRARELGFGIKYEAFADRNYNENLSLVSRKERNAVLTEPSDVLQHLVTMVKDDKVLTIGGKEKHIKADTYCLHGDTPNALQILTYLSQELPKQNIFIKK